MRSGLADLVYDAGLALFLSRLLLATLSNPGIFVPRFARPHRLLGLAMLVYLAVGLADGSPRAGPLVPRGWLFAYDAGLSCLGLAVTVSAAIGFGAAHRHVVNAASGILDPAATVTPSEMWEHAFYQGLNLVQAAYLHAIPLLSERPSPALRLGCGWLTAAPWLLRHRFPVNSFSANWRATRQREEQQERQQEAGTKALGRTSTPTRLVRRMYMLKKGQYLLYKHVLLHGLNASLAVDGAAAFAAERHFRQYWLCLNTAYVLEFFLQTLVKKGRLGQRGMLQL